MRSSKFYYLVLVVGFVVLTVSLFVAFRDLSIGTDSHAYRRGFLLNLSGSYEGGFESGFLAFMTLSSWIVEEYEFFLLLSSLVLVVSSFYSLYIVGELDRAWRDNKVSLLLVLFSLMLASPFFFANQVNIIRHGLSVPFLLFALTFFYRGRYFAFFLFGILAVSFHWISMVFLLLSPLLRFKVKILIILTLLLSVLYLTDLSSVFMGFVASVLGFESWYTEQINYASWAGYQAGVRVDFWLFSAFFVAISAYLDRRLGLDGLVVKLMVLLFVPFLVIGFIAFSDRLLVNLWFMIPLVMVMAFRLAVSKIDKRKVFFAANYLFLVCSFFVISRLV